MKKHLNKLREKIASGGYDKLSTDEKRQIFNFFADLTDDIQADMERVTNGYTVKPTGANTCGVSSNANAQDLHLFLESAPDRMTFLLYIVNNIALPELQKEMSPQ